METQYAKTYGIQTTVLRRELIAINIYVKKRKRFQINNSKSAEEIK
jgi:hypothetical protein